MKTILFISILLITQYNISKSLVCNTIIKDSTSAISKLPPTNHPTNEKTAEWFSIAGFLLALYAFFIALSPPTKSFIDVTPLLVVLHSIFALIFAARGATRISKNNKKYFGKGFCLATIGVLLTLLIYKTSQF